MWGKKFPTRTGPAPRCRIMSAADPDHCQLARLCSAPLLCADADQNSDSNLFYAQKNVLLWRWSLALKKSQERCAAPRRWWWRWWQRRWLQAVHWQPVLPDAGGRSPRVLHHGKKTYFAAVHAYPRFILTMHWPPVRKSRGCSSD